MEAAKRFLNSKKVDLSMYIQDIDYHEEERRK